MTDSHRMSFLIFRRSIPRGVGLIFFTDKFFYKKKDCVDNYIVLFIKFAM